jgi:type III restriction enzyme
MKSKGFIDNTNVKDEMLNEDTISTVDIDSEQSSQAGTNAVRASETDLMFEYYDLIRQNLNGLAYVRSKSPINGAIVEAFSKYYSNIPRSIKLITIQRLVLKNKSIFSEILSKSTSKYRDILIGNAGKTGVVKDFEIQPSKSYSRETYTSIQSKLALYQPFRMLITNQEKNKVNELEKSFIKYLDNYSKYIDWHWQNGSEVMEVNFGISYNNGVSTFQPDFIVKFRDGRIGIFDTKPIGERVEDTRVKAEALFKYIESENQLRSSEYGELVGGIIVSKNYSDFYVYNEEKYVDFSDSRENWKIFEMLFSN